MGKRNNKERISRSLRTTCERLAANDPGLTVFMTDKAISPVGIEALSSTLPTNTHLNCIYLEGSNLSKDGSLQVLVKALQQNSSVENLYLYSNKINDEGAVALASLLKKDKFNNPSLKVLALYGNRIGCVGTKVLMHALQLQQKQAASDDKVRKLERLDLRDNSVGNEGAEALIETLKRSAFLKSLFVEGNDFDNDIKERLVKSVEENYFVHHFGMDYTNSTQQERVSFALRLNQAGRRLLRGDNCPATLWSTVLSKIKQPDLMHYFLKANPRLFMSPRPPSNTRQEQQPQAPRGKRRKRPCRRDNNVNTVSSRGVKRPRTTSPLQEQPLHVPQAPERMKLTLSRVSESGENKPWGGAVDLVNMGGMCVVSRAPLHLRSQLGCGDVILASCPEENRDDLDTKEAYYSHEDITSFDRVLRFFRTRHCPDLVVKRVPPISLRIARRRNSSWGIWLEGRSNLCFVGACDRKVQEEKLRLSCGDLIWSVRDERHQEQVGQPGEEDDKDRYQRIVNLFKTNHVLYLEIKRLGPLPAPIDTNGC